MKLVEQLITTSPRWSLPADMHCLIGGASGTGKTGAAELKLRAALQQGDRAVFLVDPEGELTDHLTEFAANPANGITHRIHVLRPASSTECFGFPLLDVRSDDLQACHQAAVRTRTILEQVVNFGADEFGPRLSKMLHLGVLRLALAGRPLAALPDLFSRDTLRATMDESFPYEFMDAEWSGFDVLAERNPRALMDYTDPLQSRLLPLFGSPLMRRVFGQGRGHNVDLDRIIASREALFLNLEGLEPKEAVLIGTTLFSMLYDVALKSPVTATPVASITLEEAADYLTPDVCRGLDRMRKRGFFVDLLIHRFAQCIKPNDPSNALLSAVLTNCRAKAIFGGLAPDDAEVMAGLLFTGAINLDTIYKDGSVRPVAIGNDKVTLTSQAAGRHHLEQSADGRAATRAKARMRGFSDTTLANWGAVSFTGQASAASRAPDAGIITPATPLSFTRSSNSGRGNQRGGGRARANVSAFQDSEAVAVTHIDAVADGISAVEGTHEAFVTRFAELATESYSLEEKIHALTGLLVTQPKRSCIVKIGSEAPVVARTPDLTPAFSSAVFRALVLPLYQARLAQSPYLRPVAEIDAEIAASLAALREPDIIDADFSEPEPTRLPPRGDNRS